MTGSVQWYGDQIYARIRIGAEQGVAQGLSIIESRAVQLILDGQKSGRIYRRRGVLHQASAPGEAPASDTGQLVNAREIEMNPQGDLFEVSGRLNFTSKHAPYLEHGTIHMEPRPFARRAQDETRDQVLDAIHRNVAAALGR